MPSYLVGRKHGKLRSDEGVVAAKRVARAYTRDGLNVRARRLAA